MDRDLAASGFRTSRLTCLSVGGPSVVLGVIGAWEANEDECASLFCVDDGSRLAGTTVLMRERPFASAELWIWLPTSKAVRRLAPSRIDDYVLGSDFVYDDFRIWTPRFLAETTPAARSHADGTLDLSGEYEWRASRVDVEVVFDLASGLARSARWTRPESSTPLRTLQARGIEVVEGTATPEAMVVLRPGEGYESRMELLGQSSRVPLGHLSFLPADLHSAGRDLTRIAVDLGAQTC